jgi:hypothetical protein
VDTGSQRNQVYADCVDLSAVENASNKIVEPDLMPSEPIGLSPH